MSDWDYWDKPPGWVRQAMQAQHPDDVELLDHDDPAKVAEWVRAMSESTDNVRRALGYLHDGGLSSLGDRLRALDSDVACLMRINAALNPVILEMRTKEKK